MRIIGQNRHGFLAEMLHDQPRGGRADPPDRAPGEITLDAQQGGGQPDLAGSALELSAVGGVLHPASGEDRLLPRIQLRKCADHRALISPRTHGKHGIPVFRIPENGAQDDSLQTFHAMPPAFRRPSAPILP